MRGLGLAALCCGALFAGQAGASTITNGFTFAVADSCNGVGTHYHSSTGGDFGNPAGKAEVGRFFCEEVRGLSEYNLAGLSEAASAFVTFEVFRQGGLFDGDNDTPFTGTIAIYAYQGNNLENLSDFQAPIVATIGSFAVSPAVAVGNIYSFDITSVFNNAIDLGWESLGIRLQAVPLNPNSQAWTFDNFRLTTDDLTTAIPEPATWAMLIAGFGIVGLALRRRERFARAA
jgi:hypothetical protein